MLLEVEDLGTEPLNEDRNALRRREKSRAEEELLRLDILGQLADAVAGSRGSVRLFHRTPEGIIRSAVVDPPNDPGGALPSQEKAQCMR